MFDTALVVEKLDDGKNWKVMRQFIYTTHTGQHITVPCGFVTDFASIPRGLWNVFPPTGKYGHAAVVHDYLYRNTNLPRDYCDKVLLMGMEDSGVNWLSRKLIYRAVRLFGGFNRDEKNNSGTRSDFSEGHGDTD